MDRKIADWRAQGEKLLAKASETKELVILILHDEKMRELFPQFAENWWAAIPPDEREELKARYGSQIAIDIVISVLLAAFTAGSAGAAYGGAKWIATVGRLGAKVAKLLDELMDAFKGLAKALKLRKRRRIDSQRTADDGGVIETRWRPPVRGQQEVLGKSEGGPGTWEKSPKRTKGENYQEQVSGVERGVEYKTNGVNFDGYDPKRKVLLDAKDWEKWPPADKDFWHEGVLKDARRQIGAAGDAPIEWHFPNQQAKDAVDAVLGNGRIEGITTVVTPKG